MTSHIRYGNNYVSISPFLIYVSKRGHVYTRTYMGPQTWSPQSLWMSYKIGTSRVHALILNELSNTGDLNWNVGHCGSQINSHVCTNAITRYNTHLQGFFTLGL